LGELVDQYRKVLEASPAEQRSAEDTATLDRLDQEMDKIEAEIRRLETLERRDALLHPVGGIRPEPTQTATVGEDHEQRLRIYAERWGSRGRQLAHLTRESPLATREYRDAFGRWLLHGEKGLAPEEHRALSMGAATEGGYTVPSEEFLAELLKGVDDQAVIRQLARGFLVTNAQSLGTPSLEADPADPDWTTEIGEAQEDASMSFGKREFRPNPLSKLLKVSDKLLRASPLSIETLIRDRLAYKLGIAQAKAFNTGDGNAKPLGVYVASDAGIPSSRDVEIGNGSGAVDPDKLITARYTLKAAYWSRPSTRWHFHRNWLAKFRKLKDSTGQYLWQPGLTTGAPSTFLDFPYVLDEYAPSATTHGAGVYAAILGDWSNYWIVDALTTRIQRLDELYAPTRQVGFIIDAEVDGMPVLAEAFVRLAATT